MPIRALILATLAATGCGTTCGGIESAPFEVDRSLADEEVVALLSYTGKDSLDDVTCDEACAWVENWDAGRFVVAIDDCTLDDTDVEPVVACTGESQPYCEGRRPLGHHEAGDGDDLPAFLARAAHLEAASVTAFAQLAAQLRAWGAPRDLVARCRRAAAEEAVHAARMARHARAAGAEVPPTVHTEGQHTLFAAALHNAVEGCVHETWAALSASWRAARAAPALRDAFGAIAPDEQRHAQLAWDLHAWFLAHLDPHQRDAVRVAQADAIARLPDIARWQADHLPADVRPSEALVAMAPRFAAGLAEIASA